MWGATGGDLRVFFFWVGVVTHSCGRGRGSYGCWCSTIVFVPGGDYGGITSFRGGCLPLRTEYDGTLSGCGDVEHGYFVNALGFTASSTQWSAKVPREIGYALSQPDFLNHRDCHVCAVKIS